VRSEKNKSHFKNKKGLLFIFQNDLFFTISGIEEVDKLNEID